LDLIAGTAAYEPFGEDDQVPNIHPFIAAAKPDRKAAATYFYPAPIGFG
jgi:hypothetical protein